MTIKLIGNWKKGFALDLHTKSSEYLGVDEFGRDRFDTKRTEIGELVYKLKYGADISSVSKLVDCIQQNIRGLDKLDYLVPVPPSKSRTVQPLFLIAEELSKRIKIPFIRDAILKIKRTPEIKEVFDQEEREALLADSYQYNDKYNFANKNILLLDDLYRSGTTLRVITSILYENARVKNVFVITLTKTRSLR
jgi:predicted amidophosphoribosyltransferase